MLPIKGESDDLPIPGEEGTGGRKLSEGLRLLKDPKVGERAFVGDSGRDGSTKEGDGLKIEAITGVFPGEGGRGAVNSSSVSSEKTSAFGAMGE